MPYNNSKRRLLLLLLSLVIYIEQSLSFTVLINPLLHTMSNSPTSVMMRNDTSHEDTNKDHDSDKQQFLSTRSLILNVGILTGRLCGVANTHLPPDNSNSNSNSNRNRKIGSSSPTNECVVVSAISDLFQGLMQTAHSVDISLPLAISKKLALNNKKYPVELCKGKPGKYTQYSHATGVTKTNQSTLDQVVEPSVQEHEKLQQDKSVLFVQNFGNLANEIAEFSEARAWTQFHTPRNIILALLGEVGELAELVQWKGDNEDEDANANVTFTEQELDKMGQELADVTIYLLRLTFVCQLVEPVQTSLQDSLSVLEE